MEEKLHLEESKLRSLAEIEFSAGTGPVAHKVRFLDPRVVEAHFSALPVKRLSAEERWRKKAHAPAFPGV